MLQSGHIGQKPSKKEQQQGTVTDGSLTSYIMITPKMNRQTQEINSNEQLFRAVE
jgi:hypothetical protein